MIKKPVKKFLYLHRHLDRYQSLTSCGQSHILPFPKKIQRNSPTTFCVILLYRQTQKGKNMTVFTQECTLVSQKGNSGVDLSQDMGVRVSPVKPSNCFRLHPIVHFDTLVTLLHPQAQSSLKITNRSFRYAAPHLWNKLPPSLRVPCQSATSECSPPSPGSDSAPKSVVGVSHRVFHSRLKTHLFSISFPP